LKNLVLSPLKVLHPDEISPREAMEALYRLKSLIDKVKP
jgi:hypothetical protein